MAADSNSTGKKRAGDAVESIGGYHYEAAVSGPAVQRFWHYTKKLAIQQYLCPKADDFVLDVGCGSGMISGFLGESGAEVLGIDGNSTAIDFARKTFETGRVQFHQGLVDDRVEIPRPADKIYCLELIEHIYCEQGLEMLRLFHDYLKPGGAVFLTTPNYRSIWPVVEWMLDHFTGTPRLDHDQHVCRYHPSVLRTLSADAGFTVRSLKTVSFLAPWFAPVSWRLALTLHKIDSRLPAHLGCICVLVLRKM